MMILNREKMRHQAPVLTEYAERVSGAIAVVFAIAGFVFGSAWCGFRAGFVVGRDI